MLDRDGYPTEETLDKIREWECKKAVDFHNLMNFVGTAWKYSETKNFFSVDQSERGWEYTLVTGGWSGNEDIIAALKGNQLFWMLCWWSSNAGGTHVFRVREFRIAD